MRGTGSALRGQPAAAAPVAYRMLGSVSEADDAVQEAWLRLSRTDATDREPRRLADDGGRADLARHAALAHARREEPLGVHVPEPIVARRRREQQALIADSVGLALLVVLETLEPAERLAFVLHDMFAVPFDQIAPIVDRTPAAARQLASRARRRVRGAVPEPDADLPRSARSSTRSSRPPATATSPRSWRCSTPTS